VKGGVTKGWNENRTDEASHGPVGCSPKTEKGTKLAEGTRGRECSGEKIMKGRKEKLSHPSSEAKDINIDMNGRGKKKKGQEAIRRGKLKT